jgi:hypothetical protein
MSTLSCYKIIFEYQLRVKYINFLPSQIQKAYLMQTNGLKISTAALLELNSSYYTYLLLKNQAYLSSIAKHFLLR